MPGIHLPGERIESWDDQIDRNQAVKQSNYRANCRQILVVMHPRSGESLLDIGCGNGLLLSMAVSLGIRSVGIEDTPEAAAISQKTAPQAKIVVGSEIELPFDECQFELVTALDFLNYFPEPEEGLREIHRVLKPGGRACIVLPNAEFSSNQKNLQGEDVPPIAFSLKIWKKMIESSGLEVFTVYPNLSYAGAASEQSWLKKLVRLGLRILWRLRPLRWSDQFICYCSKS